MVKSGLQSQEATDRFQELCNNEDGWDLILRWATEEDHTEAHQRFNQLNENGESSPAPDSIADDLDQAINILREVSRFLKSQVNYE